MKLDKLAKYSLVALSLSLYTGSLINTTGGAVFAFGFGGTKPAAQQPAAQQPVTQSGAQPAVQQPVAETNPQIEAAAKRVDTAKVNLDLARKRLDATKALVKAAEAEYKAAKTDKDALVLNTQAQQLADASGLPKNGENVPAVPATTPGSAPGVSPVYNSSESTIDYSGNANANLGAPAPSAQ